MSTFSDPKITTLSPEARLSVTSGASKCFLASSPRASPYGVSTSNTSQDQQRKPTSNGTSTSGVNAPTGPSQSAVCVDAPTRTNTDFYMRSINPEISGSSSTSFRENVANGEPTHPWTAQQKQTHAEFNKTPNPKLFGTCLG